jgi:hypothetical protein
MSRAEDGETRRSRGFERASLLVAPRVRRAGEGRGFAVSKVLTHWAEVAGEEIAALARPAEVSYGREGMGATLTLLASGAAAPLLQMRLPEIRERVNACYGYAAIARVRITQSAAQGLAEGFAEAPAAFEPAAEADPAARREAEAAARGVGDPDLRAALEQLGRNVFSKS